MGILAVLAGGRVSVQKQEDVGEFLGFSQLGARREGEALSRLPLLSCFSCLCRLGLLGTQPRLALRLGADPWP